MDIKQLTEQIHQDAISKGWYEGMPTTFPEFLALCHSELSEALELFRDGNKVSRFSTKETEKFGVTKPFGIPIELADCIIRILDGCGYYDIDIQEAIKQKMQFNKTRDYRHGNKLL